MNHGGKREGSGAKKQAPPNSTRRTFLLTDKEHQLIKEYLKKLRSVENDTKL